MVVRKQAQIVVTAATDQAVGQFERLASSEERATDKLSQFVEKARAANDAARFAGFDKATEAAKQLTPALNKASLGIEIATKGISQFSMGAGVGGIAAGSLKTGIMAASSALGPLGMLLTAGGIAAFDFAKGQYEAADATEEANRAIQQQLRLARQQREDAVRIAKDDAYRERMNREYWADRQREVDARGEELKAIENTLAQHGRGRDMSAMLAREAEIRADNAATMGRHEEAAQIRREEELRVLGELGDKDRQRGAAKKEEARWSVEITNQLRMQKNLASFTREGSDSRDFAAEMREAKAGEVRQSFVEHRKQQQIDAMATEIRGQESMLEIKLQGLERERAAGVDPWSLAQREADAKLFALEAHQRYVDETMVGQERMLANAELASQRQQILHEKELQRIARDQREREKARARIAMIGNSVSRVHEGVAAAALRAAFTSGQSVRQSVKHFAAGQALEMGITGTTELIRGAVAAASYNYPKAAMHFTNAGMAFAESAALGAVYGVASIGGGGKGRGGGGNQGAMFGLGQAGGDGGGGQATSPRSGSIGQGPPISRPTGSATPPPRAGGPIRSGGGTTINIYSLTGPDSAQMTEVRRALKRSERDDGDVN